MTDMACSSSESEDLKTAPMPQDDSGGPKYPWGLELRLETESLKKLGLKATDFKIGDKVPMTVLALVTSISSSQSQNGPPSECVCLIAADITIGDSKGEDAAEKLFGKK